MQQIWSQDLNQDGCLQSLHTEPSHNSDILSFYPILWTVESWQGFISNGAIICVWRSLWRNLRRLKRVGRGWNPKQEEGGPVLITVGDNGGLNQAVEWIYRRDETEEVLEPSNHWDLTDCWWEVTVTGKSRLWWEGKWENTVFLWKMFVFEALGITRQKDSLSK